MFFLELTILSNFINENSLLSATSLNCISMENQECKARPQVITINSNNPIFYSFSIKINKCSGNCNNINNPYAKICVPDVIKDLNVKVFNLMSRTNETRFIKWNKKCNCKCRLDTIICNSKQRWNKNKCRCECKELIVKGVCDEEFIWDPSNCECECDRNCDFSENLEHENCKCRKKLVDKLIDECTETIEEVKLVKITPMEFHSAENESENKYSSCTVYIVLMIVVLTIFNGITIYFVYYNWSLIKSNVSCIKFNTPKESKIW